MKNLTLFPLVMFLLFLSCCASPVTSASIGELLDSAEDGDAYSQLLLGYKYYNGQDVPQDYKEARHWYRKSARQGYADAQIYLGTMLHNGEGGPVDYIEAYMWLQLASNQGHARAMELLNLIADKMNSMQVTEAKKRALQWPAK